MRRRTRQAEAPPLLAPECLLGLAVETTTAAAESFAASYASLLPDRVDRIIQNVGTGNRHQGIDAALSLKAASAMAGALRMSHMCRQMEEALVMADMAAALTIARDIKLHLPDLQEALAARPPMT